MSQGLAAWCIERHLESCRLGLLYDKPKGCNQYEGSYVEQTKSELINQVLPGLQGLEDMISIAHDLPHPAVSRIQHNSMLRATVLIDLTLDLLTKLSLIVHTRKVFEGIDIIRYTNKDGAALVNIVKDNTSRNSARVVIPAKGTALRDKPTDSPEYIVVFGLTGKNRKNHIDASHHQFFEQVYIQSTQQETSNFSQALSRIKKEKPSLFQRHLVFILRVSRSTRTLLVYNAGPGIRAKMELAFNDIEEAALKLHHRHHSALQTRCLRHISFLPNDSPKQQSTPIDELSDSIQNPIKQKADKAESVVKRGPARRIVRPTSMLRPTLIGKSVQGAAMQAVAANRLRARSRPSLPQRTLTSKYCVPS